VGRCRNQANAGAIVCGGGIVKVLELIDRRMTKWLGLIGAFA
jgi:hypothetical protein